VDSPAGPLRRGMNSSPARKARCSGSRAVLGKQKRRTGPHLRHRGGSVGRRGPDGLRHPLPGRRSTRSAGSPQGPHNALVPARPNRLAVGDRRGRGRTTRSTPIWVPEADFRHFVRAAAQAGLEVAMDLALAVRAGPSLGDRAPDGSPPGPTARSPTRRTRRRRPGHLSGQLDTTRPGSGRGAAGGAAWVHRGIKTSGGTTRTPSR